MLSYKNHALDEFLCDVVEHSPIKLTPGMLIRTGKPENAALMSYAERGSAGEKKAEDVLKLRVDTVRLVQKICRDWRDCATYMDTKMFTNKVI